MSGLRQFLFDTPFDDLDSSLDRALDASNSFFNSRSSHDQQVNGSIPMTDIVLDEERHAAHEYDDDGGDGIPLMRNSYSNTQSRSSISLGHRSISNSIRKTSNWLQTLKYKLHLGKLKLPTTNNNLSINNNQNSERYISTKSNLNNDYISNSISNAKYNPITFIPLILYEQFKFFFNLYFLIVALSQIVPQLRIGYLSSYVVPLAFVLTVTMMKEAGDDITRRRRDREQNYELFEVLNRSITLSNESTLVKSKDLKVGDIVKLHKGRRIPADMILLQTSEKDGSGEAFIKTDQLDGETDWKLRVANNVTQNLQILQLINSISLIVEAPNKSIHLFNGKLIYQSQGISGTASPLGNNTTYPLTVDQTLWANTVLASGTAIGIIIYTGNETRQQMNTTKSGVKIGLLELEINNVSKALCATVFILSVVLVLAQGFPLNSNWYLDIMRFLILFSTIIPVSLRVNLDLAKSVYANQIQKDKSIEGTIVRTSTIPEDLGRIEYLLSDKTGTLTQNDMEMKKLHLGTVSYAGDTFDIVSDYINLAMSGTKLGSIKKKDLTNRVYDLVLTLALCHNVTPTYEDDKDEINGIVSYQAASPDEIAIVKFTELVGLKLYKRDRHTISVIHLSTGRIFNFEILYIFPFNSDTKRMGILVKDCQTEELWFMEKGADTVMSSIVNSSDWLDEETGNMAREGLRTLVIARKKLQPVLYQEFVDNYQQASITMHNREANLQKVISRYLEKDLELLGLTGVEDKLQTDVKSSIELLRNAGIKIWMLTGDKVETAKCVSINARLISRGQYVHQITKLSHNELVLNQLDYLRTNLNACLIIDGESLSMFMKYHQEEFFEVAIKLPSVIACRCTPQQKADVAMMIRDFTGKRVCCIGDGGNDVSMIQCADVGVGIVGKEGKQASLAADFSIDQFCYLSKLLLWHGRNSYKRSAKLSQFIIHRGLLISVAQAVYSISSNFEPLALYQGWLMVGYATVYTMGPVFSLTLDCDIDEHLTRLYPELYRELTLGTSLSYKTFFMWVFISLYQGIVIQMLSQTFISIKTEDFLTMVALSYSLLIYNELIMVGMSINKWTKVMIITIIITLLIYLGSIPFLSEYFDLTYMRSVAYVWQTTVILSISLLPVWLAQYVNRKLRPPSYAKVQQD